MKKRSKKKLKVTIETGPQNGHFYTKDDPLPEAAERIMEWLDEKDARIAELEAQLRAAKSSVSK